MVLHYRWLWVGVYSIIGLPFTAEVPVLCYRYFALGPTAVIIAKVIAKLLYALGWLCDNLIIKVHCIKCTYMDKCL